MSTQVEGMNGLQSGYSCLLLQVAVQAPVERKVDWQSGHMRLPQREAVRTEVEEKIVW